MKREIASVPGPRGPGLIAGLETSRNLPECTAFEKATIPNCSSRSRRTKWEPSAKLGSRATAADCARTHD